MHSRWRHEIPRTTNANHGLRPRSTNREERSGIKESLPTIHPHGVRAPRSTVQGLSLPHIETLTEKTHETILYTSRTSATHDPRSSNRGPQLISLEKRMGHMVGARGQALAAHEQRSTAREPRRGAAARLVCTKCVPSVYQVKTPNWYTTILYLSIT